MKHARGPALVQARIDDDVQQAYAVREAKAGAAVDDYASRVDSRREQLELTAHPTRPSACVLTLSEESLMTVAELEGTKRACVSDKGPFAKALNRRNPRAVKLPEETKELHLCTSRGRKVAVLLRNVLDAKVAARGHAALEAIHNTVSIGWMQGCEVRSRPYAPMVSPTPPWPQPRHDIPPSPCARQRDMRTRSAWWPHCERRKARRRTASGRASR